MTSNRDTAVRAWGSASEAELLIAQILAIDAWFQAGASHLDGPPTDSRTDLVERRRQVTILESIRDVIRDRAGRALAAEPGPWTAGVPPRFVMVNRNPWFAGQLSESLAAYGLRRVAHLVTGAEALGVTIAEQPDLLIIEEAMSMLSGQDVLQHVQEFSPRTLVAIQTDRPHRASVLAEMGADVVLLRALSPVDVAADLAALVALHRDAAVGGTGSVPG